MLILSRRIDESIRIGDEITVTILEIKGKNVRIGINAPHDVEIHREEVYERIQAEHREADTEQLSSRVTNAVVKKQIHK